MMNLENWRFSYHKLLLSFIIECTVDQLLRDRLYLNNNINFNFKFCKRKVVKYSKKIFVIHNSHIRLENN